MLQKLILTGLHVHIHQVFSGSTSVVGEIGLLDFVSRRPPSQCPQHGDIPRDMSPSGRQGYLQLTRLGVWGSRLARAPFFVCADGDITGPSHENRQSETTQGNVKTPAKHRIDKNTPFFWIIVFVSFLKIYNLS